MPAPSTATPATAEDTVEHAAEHTAQKAGNGVPMPADGPRHRMLETDSCTRWLGGEVLLAEPGHAKLRMRAREEMTNGFKIAHLAGFLAVGGGVDGQSPLAYQWRSFPNVIHVTLREL